MMRLPITRKIVLGLIIFIFILVIFAIPVWIFQNPNLFINEKVVLILSQTVSLLLALIAAFPVLQNFVQPENNLSDEQITNAVAELAQSQTAFDNQQYELAIKKATEVIKLLPQQAEAYRIRGQAYKAMGKLVSALDDFTSAIKLEPGFPFTYSMRSDIYKQMGNYSEMIPDLVMAMGLSPELPHNLFELAYTFFMLGKFEEAEKLFSDYLSNPRKDAKTGAFAEQQLERIQNLKSSVNLYGQYLHHQQDINTINQLENT